MVLFGTTLSFTASSWAQEGHNASAQQNNQPREAACDVKAIYELKESEDGKSLEVYNEAGGLISSLSVSQLAGLNGKARRFMLSDECMSATDKVLLSLIEANPVEDNQKKDPHAEALVYTGSSGEINGLKFYEFDQELQTHVTATEICKAKGLRLMTKSEAESLKKELEADKSKLKKWFNGQTYVRVWTSSVHSGSSYSAWYLYAGDNGDVSVYDNRRGYGRSVRCVAR